MGANSSLDTSRVGRGTAVESRCRMPGPTRKPSSLIWATSQSVLRALLDALAEREPEAVAPLRALLEIPLRLRLLLPREGLRVRETDAPAALFDGQHQDPQRA